MIMAAMYFKAVIAVKCTKKSDGGKIMCQHIGRVCRNGKRRGPSCKDPAALPAPEG